MENVIRDFRMKTGITQREFAQLAGISLVLVSKLESNLDKIEGISAISAWKISKAIGISMEELLTRGGGVEF